MHGYSLGAIRKLHEEEIQALIDTFEKRLEKFSRQLEIATPRFRQHFQLIEASVQESRIAAKLVYDQAMCRLEEHPDWPLQVSEMMWTNIFNRYKLSIEVNHAQLIILMSEWTMYRGQRNE